MRSARQRWSARKAAPVLAVLVAAFVAAAAAACAQLAGAIKLQLPGLSPMSYTELDDVPVRVNALTSSVAIMPFPFYSVKTCTPSARVIEEERKRENIGELMWGEQIEPSLYNVRVRKNVSCAKLCDALTYTEKEALALKRLIELQYRGNLILDGLPVAQLTRPQRRQPKVILGYPLGTPSQYNPNKATTVNNHLVLRIKYHVPDIKDVDLHETFRIVGFFASAHSVKFTNVDEQCVPTAADFAPETYPALEMKPGATVPYTYTVEWVEDPDVAWATRWDIYLSGAEQDNRIHWFSIVNSLLVVFVLSAVVGMILLRALKRDFAKFNEIDPEAVEESGWKYICADVFRPPQHPVVLTALVSAGTQIAAMFFITIFVACLGYMSPSRRGSALSLTIQLWALLGLVSGYVAGRLLKLFGVQAWRNVFASATLVPGLVFALYFALNLVQWYKHASSAVRVTTLLLLCLLWLGVALPLVLMGAAAGFRATEAPPPCRVNDVERLIKEQPAHLHWLGAPFVAGAVPFIAAFIELAFILSSFWQGRVYYVFGFVALVYLVVVLTVAETTIVLVYFTLVNEDYRWWWRSFASGAALGAHLFLYSLYYLRTYLPVRQPTSVVIYVGYMGIVSFLVACFAGAVGFLASLYFVRKIYSSIRID
jgi:transmembrane 9 superfamily protein 2/4